MPEAKVVTDVGAVAEAIREGLRMVRDLIDPDKNQDRDERKRMKYLVRARNAAQKVFNISDDLMDTLKKEHPKLHSKYLNARDAFDKAKRRT